MAYDQTLADRIWAIVGADEAFVERKMFGGLAFLLDGRMIGGIIGDELMARVGRDYYAEALAEPHVRPMDFTGKPMKGYVYVRPEGIVGDEALRRWIERGIAAAQAAPRKARR